MVTHAPLTGGEARRTWLVLLTTLAAGTLPILSLLSLGLARSLGIGGFPPKYVNPQHAFWHFTMAVWWMSLAAPVGSGLTASIYLLLRARLRSGAVPVLAPVVILAYLSIVYMPIPLGRFLQNSGVLKD